MILEEFRPAACALEVGRANTDIDRAADRACKLELGGLDQIIQVRRGDIADRALQRAQDYT